VLLSHPFGVTYGLGSRSDVGAPIAGRESPSSCQGCLEESSQLSAEDSGKVVRMAEEAGVPTGEVDQRRAEALGERNGRALTYMEPR
jgi:hypothetical protein